MPTVSDPSSGAEPGAVGISAKRVAVGGSWMVLARFGLRAIGLVSTLVLARILVPADFGLVALATTIIGVLDIMSEFSFDSALIRDRDADKVDYDTAWTLTVAKQLAMAALLAAGAGLAADAFREPRIEDILYVLAIGTAFECAANIGVVDLQKNFQFNRQFVYLIGPKLIAVIVTVALALIWRSYWALVAGILSSKLVKVMLSYALVRYRPAFSLARARALIHFSKWLLLNNVCIFLNLQIDTFIIGRMLGAQALGLFSLTKEVAMLPTTELVWPLAQVILPTFARIGRDTVQLSRGLLESTAIVWLVGAPAGIGIALVADLAVPVFLGDKWLDAIPLMQVLAVSGAFRVLYSMSGSVFLVLDKPFLIAILATASVSTTVPALLVGIVSFGLVGATYAVMATTLISVGLNFFMVWRVLRLGPSHYIAVLWRPTLACLIMSATILALRTVIEAPSTVAGDAIWLGIFAATGVVTYAASELALWWLSGRPLGAEARLLSMIKLQRLVARA